MAKVRPVWKTRKYKMRMSSTKHSQIRIEFNRIGSERSVIRKISSEKSDVSDLGGRFQRIRELLEETSREEQIASIKLWKHFYNLRAPFDMESSSARSIRKKLR